MRRCTIPLFLLITILLTSACKDKKSSKENNVITVDSTVLSNPEDVVKRTTYADTVKINYQVNQEILDIIPLIPDTAMQSWEWSKTERKAFLSMVKTSNYFVDTTRNYNTIIQIKPHYFATQVVDGVFTAASYKLNNGTLLIITCDIVGDGKHLCAYRLDQEVLTSVNMNDILGDVKSIVLFDLNNTKCIASVEEAEPFSDYDFTKTNAIEISLPLTKAKSQDCLKGNTVKFIFNADSGRFDFQSVKWL